MRMSSIDSRGAEGSSSDDLSESELDLFVTSSLILEIFLYL